MFCSNCGNLLEEQDKFCANCGMPVKRTEPEFARLTESVPEKSPVKKKSGVIIAVLSAVALIVLIILLVCVAVSEKRAGKTFEKYRSQFEMDRDEDEQNEIPEFYGDSLF